MVITDWEAEFREHTHELLDITGTTVRLETLTETGNYDEHGHPITNVHDVQTPAEIIYRGTPVFDRNFSGVDSDVKAIVYLKDSVEIPISATESATGAEATRVYVMDETAGTPEKLAVYTSKKERNGKIRLHCENFHG